MGVRCAASYGRGSSQQSESTSLRALCCAGFMTVLLVVGVMDLWAMAAVTAGITSERFAPRPGVTARAIGMIAIAAGALVGVRALLVTP